MERAILQDPKQVPAPPIQCYPSVFQLTVTHIQHFALTVPGGQGSIQNRSLKIVTSTMLPWRVMNIERHWDVQENSVRMRCQIVTLEREIPNGFSTVKRSSVAI